jgi:pentapeptide MXKDX repeat protein
MRKLIIATTALAFVSSTALVPSIAFAQDKGAATSTDTTKAAPGKMSKKHMKKSKKSEKKAGSEDTMKKQ